MKKDLKELVRISFEGVDLLGHIEINNDTKLLNLRTDNHELIERFDKNWDETFVFHCKKLNREFISLFRCFLTHRRDGHSGELEFIFKPSIYIDNSYEIEARSVEDIKLNTLTARYSRLHPLFKNSNSDEAIYGLFNYGNDEIVFKIKPVTYNNINQFEEVQRRYLCVTFTSKKKQSFSYFADLFFKFSTVVSFLSNAAVFNDSFSYKNPGAFPTGNAQIYYSGSDNSTASKKLKLNNYNHRLKLKRNEIQSHIIEPMVHKNFKLFMYFVSTLRFNDQPIEDKFLNYYRCLESLAVYHTESNQKYSTENLNSLLESLEKTLNNSDDLFENEDIDHIVKSTQKNNFMPSGEVTEKLILDRLAIESIDVKGENEPLSQFLKHLRGLRDKLSHGRSYELKTKDIKRIMKLKDIVKDLLIKEQGIEPSSHKQDYEFEPLDMSQIQNSMEEFDAWEKSIEEKEDYNLTFEELKEKVQRFIEEKNTDDEKEN